MTNNKLNAKRSTINSLARAALFVSVAALEAAGCDEAIGPEEVPTRAPLADIEDEADEPASARPAVGLADVESPEAATVSSCECQSGFWRCPTDGSEFEYWVPNCLGDTSPQARSQCEESCPATCVNLGWFNWC